MAKLSDVYGITKPSKRPKADEVRVKSKAVFAPPMTKLSDVYGTPERKFSDGVRFVLFIDNATADGLEKERAKRGLRSRSETIRVLLAEALK